LNCRDYQTVQRNKQDGYNELAKLLESAITKEVKDGIVSISYCPDNTCETFSMPSRNPEEKLCDFVYLYLYFVSDYYYLDDFRKKVGSEKIGAIIVRNERITTKNDHLQEVKDVIESMAKEYSIKATFVRYDESTRSETAIDIQSELKRIKR